MSEVKVSWKMPGLFNGADAEKCFKEIGDKGITPEMLLEKAKDRNSELHKCFTWDDEEAAYKYRLQQATLVIRQLVVSVKEEEVQPRRVFQISSEKHEYQPISFFMKNQNEYELLLERAKNEMNGFVNRYRSVAELDTVIEVIEEFLNNN